MLLQWVSSSDTDFQSLEVLSALKNELEKQGKLVHPKIYIQPDCGDTESLKSYVKNLGGLLASSAGEFSLDPCTYSCVYEEVYFG